MVRPLPGHRSRVSPDYDGPAAAIAQRRIVREARADAVDRIHKWYENRPEENRRGPRKKRHTIYTRRLRRLAALRGNRNRRRRLHREQILLAHQQEQAQVNSPDEDPFVRNAQTPPQARSPAAVDDDEQQHASSHSSHHSADHSVHHSEQSEASFVSDVFRSQHADDNDDALTTDGKDTVDNASETTASGSDEESHRSADEPNDADQDASSDSQPARCIPRQELDELTKVAQSPSKPGPSSGVELVVRSSAPTTATTKLQSPTPSTSTKSTQGIVHRTRTKTQSSSDRSNAKGGKSSKDNDIAMQRREPTQCDWSEASTQPASSSEQMPQPTTTKVEQKSELLSESANRPTAPEESPKHRSPDSPKDRHSAKKHREKSEPGPSVQQPETSTAHSCKKSVRSSTSKSSNSAVGSERNQKTDTADDQSTDSSQKATTNRNPDKDDGKRRMEPTQCDRSEASTQLESTSEQTPQPTELKHQPEQLTKSAKTNPQPAAPKEAPKPRSPDSPKDRHSAKKHHKKSEPGPSGRQPETSTAHSRKSLRSSTKNDGQNSQMTGDTADDRSTDDSKQTATTDSNTTTAERPKAAESSQATEDHEDRQNRPGPPDSGGSKEMTMDSPAEASSSQTSERLKSSLRRDAEASSSAADGRSASKATKGSCEDRSGENSNKTEPETEATKQAAGGKEKATKGTQTKQRGDLGQLVLQQARALKNCKKGRPDDAQCQPPE